MGKLIKGVNDLETWCEQHGRMDLLLEWDYEKNDNLLPADIAIGSTRMVWWTGSCGHSWDIRLCTRIKLNTKCPFCTGKRILSGFNDLATTHPDLANEWNYKKNKGLKNKFNKDISTPDKVSAGSPQKVWWIGACGHEWCASIQPRAKHDVGCPKCNLELHTSFNEQAIFYYLSKYFPDAINGDKTTIDMELDIYVPSINVAIEYDGAVWHKNTAKDKKKNIACKNRGITLIRVREGNAVIYDDCICIVRKDIRSKTTLKDVIIQIFSIIDSSLRIDIDIQKDETAIRNRYMFRRKTNSLAVLYPDIASEWHPTKNDSLTPDKVFSGSTQLAWWLGKCGHEWQTRIASRSKGVGCPYCNKGGGSYVISGINDLHSVNPDIAKEWDYEKNTGLRNGFGVDISSPNKINNRSSASVWWVCKLGHSYKTSVYKRTVRGEGCPYCSNHRVLIGFNDLYSRYPKIAQEWHPTKNGEILPTSVVYGSGSSVWWLCNNGHTWKKRIVDRTKYHYGCPYCKITIK